MKNKTKQKVSEKREDLLYLATVRMIREFSVLFSFKITGIAGKRKSSRRRICKCINLITRKTKQKRKNSTIPYRIHIYSVAVKLSI